MIIWCQPQGSCHCLFSHCLFSRFPHVARIPNHHPLYISINRLAHSPVSMLSLQNRGLHQSSLPRRAVRYLALPPCGRFMQRQWRRSTLRATPLVERQVRLYRRCQLSFLAHTQGKPPWRAHVMARMALPKTNREAALATPLSAPAPPYICPASQL
jgi:hypothetical protein